MRRHTLSRLLALAAGLLLLAAVILGFRALKHRLTQEDAPLPEISGSAAPTATPVSGVHNGPYLLRTTYSRVGSTKYTSFEIYYTHGGQTELWYSCGRMFPSDQVRGVSWADPGSTYDIAVVHTDGKRTVFTFDGNSSWQ